MIQRGRAGLVVGGLVSALLAVAAPAGASEFCVAPATGCSGGQQSSLQGALDAALGSTGPDTVRLPTGTVQGPGLYDTANPDNTVSIVGAGRDATVITSSADGYILDIRRGRLVSDLTIKQPDPPVSGQFGTSITGDVDRVGFISVGDSSTVNGTARHVLATGPGALLIHGTLEDSELRGSTLATGTGATVVRRVRSEGPSPVFGQNSSLVISSSLFVSTSPTGAVAGFSPSPVPDSQATLLLSNVTLIGAGGPGCTGLTVSGDNFYMPPDDDTVMNATLANSIVRGCATSVARDSGGGNRTANLTIFNSDLDLSPAAVSQTGNGTLTAGPGDGNFDGDPLFLSLPGLGQIPSAGSPVIDRGLSSLLSPEESSTDLVGSPRVADGNGDGTALRDLGAFEYQRRGPAVTIQAPKTALAGQPIAFNGSATEPDPGESVAGYAWSFDDGTTATGAAASHAFAKPGQHTATLTASDSAGVTGTATATVAVGGGTVRSLSLSPAAFRAATKGGSVAARPRKRAPVGTNVPSRAHGPRHRRVEGAATDDRAALGQALRQGEEAQPRREEVLALRQGPRRHRARRRCSDELPLHRPPARQGPLPRPLPPGRPRGQGEDEVRHVPDRLALAAGPSAPPPNVRLASSQAHNSINGPGAVGAARGPAQESEFLCVRSVSRATSPTTIPTSSNRRSSACW